MERTDITLRAVKGSALTYNEMDTNFSSFFYSASAVTVNGANKLRLHYTGSVGLDAPFNTPDFVEVTLPTAEQNELTVDPPGDPNEVIFHGSNGNFAASSNLQFTQNASQGSRLGIGYTPISTLGIRSNYTGESTNLRISSATGNAANSKAILTFDQNGTSIAQLGKRGTGTNTNIDFMSKSPISIGYDNFEGTANKKLRVTSSGVSIGNDITTNAVSPLSVIGNITVGNSLNTGAYSKIGANTISANRLPGNNTAGLLISSPAGTSGGHVVIGVNTNNSNKESFSIVRGSAGTFNSTIATFRADGKVGLGKIEPEEVLHVEGNITGSGNIQVEGTATIKVDPHTVSDDVKTLVATAGGTVQYMDAAPIPKGGIIMWSGTVANIPTGWSLCDGGSVNGVDIPDLRERFIVGAGGSGTANTTVTGAAYSIGETGNNNYNRELQQNNIPKFTSNTGYSNTNFPTNSRVACGVLGVSGQQQSAYGFEEGRGNPDWSTSVISTCQHRHTFSFGSDNPEPIDVRPPYYALAFIIYVGVE